MGRTSVAGRRESGFDQQLPIGGYLGSLPGGPLVARDEELSRILAAVDAVTGGEGRVVLLAGEPGAGKTRLAQEITLEARNRRFLLASGSCFEQRQVVPYYPWLDALATLYGAAPESIRSAVPERWPLLAHLLPEAPIPVPAPISASQEEQERLFRAATGFVQAIAEQIPVAILLDDLQWADESSLNLLIHLARHTRTHRVLLLGIYRDVEVGRPGTFSVPLDRALLELHRSGLSERVLVRRLDQAGTAALMAATLGESEVSDEFVDLVYRHTEGNPFFTEEVLRGLVERGDVFRRDGVWDRREVEQIEVPESVRTVVGQRLSRLSPGAQELLQEASVLGQSFAFDVLLALANRTEEEVDTWLEEARAAGLVRAGDRDRYSFNHGLTQGTLYAELSPRRKRRLHLAAAAVLEEHLAGRQRTAELAWHFRQGDDPERASWYAIQAGDEAEKVFAHGEAERQYRAAIEMAHEVGNRGREAEGLHKLGVILKSVGRYDEALTLLEDAAGLFREVGDVEGERLAVAQIARVHRYRATLPEGIVRVERFLESSAGQDVSRGLADIYAAVSLLYSWRGQHVEHLETAERAAAIAREVGDDRLLAEAEIRRCEVLALTGRIEERRRVLEETLPLAERAGDPEILHAYLVNLGIDARCTGRLQRARALHERSLEVVERAGNVGRAGFSMCQVAEDLFYLGDWNQAADWYLRARDVLQPLGPSSYAPYPSIGLARLRLAQGALKEGSRLLEEGMAIAQGTGDAQAMEKARWCLVERDLLLGKPKVVLGRLQAIQKEFRERSVDLGVERAPGEAPRQETPLYDLFLSWARVQLGQHGEALGVTAGGIVRLAARNENLDLADLLRVRGMALAGARRWDEAEETFRESASLAATILYPYAEARALAEWGRMLLVAGAPDRARQRLEQALAIFRRLGARGDVTTTEHALAR